MKKINKMIVCILTYVALSNTHINAFGYGDNPGANFMSTAGTATMLGGAFSGNRAALGAGAGLMATGAMMNAASASRDRDRYHRDRDYDYDRRYSRSSYRERQRDLEARNAELERRLQQYENAE